ncbi:hypothetical protein [Chitinophaga sp.]|uniref:hypothetical protein n=1 Tax=Chitinophaga sp. TaxID=1869181 RepID=UPI0031DC079D
MTTLVLGFLAGIFVTCFALYVAWALKRLSDESDNCAHPHDDDDYCPVCDDALGI